jgi:hypothetical protein
MKEIKLKPCPFCGCDAVAEICNITKEFRIFCEHCPATMHLSYVDAQLGDGSFISFYEVRKIMDELTELWNERADNEQRETD